MKITVEILGSKWNPQVEGEGIAVTLRAGAELGYRPSVFANLQRRPPAL